jgi:hypothetical protein
MGRMRRVRTHMALVSSGWGPSGRRFKSGLPDSPKLLGVADHRKVSRPLSRQINLKP